ncbi:replication initiator protein [Sigmofec virus UA08Rod_5448]|uniref:Replication initiator protein n=1 Tax=Sigmofec virus UA08Rod_5448 TaxID=2929425 RepID=A0A976R5A3_9VIRU|nr:replication initiator protein [Sigmofec virus UA08Rod_5448]
MLDVGLKLASGKPNYLMLKMSDKLWDDPRCITVPCRHCIGCRLEYSRQWANRMMLELGYHDSAYFVTLTYDDYHVPISYYADPETGEAFPSLTLRKRDLQLFFKRLRFTFGGDKIRYYACGEYGTDTLRPHYHAIIFGLHLDDLVLYKQSKDGYNYYNSAKLQRCWSERPSVTGLIGNKLDAPYLPIGYVVVGQVTWDTCAYTARYVAKKLMGADAQWYPDHGMELPFTVCSRKPGIGRQYYDDHEEDIYRYDKISISTSTGGRSFRPPSYFDTLYSIEHPVEIERIKTIRRNMADSQMQLKLRRTNMSYLEYLEIEERAHVERAKRLIRSDI